MSTISPEELAKNSSNLLDRVQAGEHLVVIREGRPVAELRPVAAPLLTSRPYGLAAGAFTVPENFDSPLPDELLGEFEAP